MDRRGWVWTAAPVLALVAVISAVALTGRWNLLRIIHVPTFGDLMQITYSADCELPTAGEVGSTVCDPFGRAYNYPPVWAAAFRLLGITRGDTVPVGVTLIAVVVIALLALLWRVRHQLTTRRGVAVTAAVASPPFFLLFERGNTDLIVLSLIAAAVLVAQRGRLGPVLALGLIAVSAGLKLYPAAAIIGPAGRSWQRLVGAVAAVFLAVGILALPWMATIREVTPAINVDAFGAGVLPSQIRNLGNPGPVGLADHLIGSVVTVVLAVSSLAVPAVRRCLAGVVRSLSGSPMSWALTGVGGGMFCSAYLATTSYDYRLFSLALVVIGLAALPVGDGRTAWARWLTGACLAVMWFSYPVPRQLQPLADGAVAVFAVAMTAGVAFILVSLLVPTPDPHP